MPVPTNIREMARAFKPTANQLRAARTLLLAKAHEQSVRPVVEQYETEILAKLQFRVSTRYVRLGVEDSVILDPKRSIFVRKRIAKSSIAKHGKRATRLDSSSITRKHVRCSALRF